MEYGQMAGTGWSVLFIGSCYLGAGPGRRCGQVDNRDWQLGRTERQAATGQALEGTWTRRSLSLRCVAARIIIHPGEALPPMTAVRTSLCYKELTSIREI